VFAHVKSHCAYLYGSVFLVKTIDFCIKIVPNADNFV